MSSRTRPRIRVSDIMSKNVISLDDGKNTSDAINLMKSEGLDKILITHGGKPKGVLEEWQLLVSPKLEKISDISLGKVGETEVSSDVDDIQTQLRVFPAVAVIDKDKGVKGIVTAKDLVKLVSKSGYSLSTQDEASIG